MPDKAAQMDAFILMTDGETQLANAQAKNSSSLLVLKDIYRNKNNRLCSIIAMPVHRIRVGKGRISGSKHLLSSVSKRDCVRALEEINHGGPILVTMDRGVAARL